MSKKRLQSKAKVVQHMTRDGLVAQDLTTGTTERVSKREQEVALGGSFGGRNPAKQSHNPRAGPPKSSPVFPGQEASALKPKRRLRFEDEIKTPGKKVGIPGARMAGGVAAGAMHRKMDQTEGDNAGSDAAHHAERAGESALRTTKRGVDQYRRARPQRQLRKSIRMEKSAPKTRTRLRFKQTAKKNTLAKRSKQAKKALQQKTIKKAQKNARKAAKRVAKIIWKTIRNVTVFIVRHPVVALVIALLLAIVLLFHSCLNTAVMFGGAGGGIFGSFYQAQDSELNQAELYYTEMEADLQLKAYRQRFFHLGYDEYRYNIAELSHSPYELAGFLSAAFKDFKFSNVKRVLNDIFDQQYTLWTEAVTETRTREVTNPITGRVSTVEYDYEILNINISAVPFSSIVTPLLDAEQMQLYSVYATTRGGHFYFSPPFDFDWTYYVTKGYGWSVNASRDKELHKGVTIAAPAGTAVKAVQNGKVTYAGRHATLGNLVTIESEDGLKSTYTNLGSLSVTSGQAITRYESVGQAGSSFTLYVYFKGESLNPYFHVDPGSGRHSSGNVGYPGEPYDDATYQAILEEATRYIGYPYVWGGSTPDTSFDCSGFVCWVYAQSSAYNLGRCTAQEIYNQCAEVNATDVKPGDLVFFHSTYSTTSLVTHVGIYVGNGQMLHCGNPIGYADLNTSYWQSHFLCYGRLS